MGDWDKAGAARHRSVREDLPLLAIDTSGRWFALVHAGELHLSPLAASPAAAPATPPLSTSAVECARFDRTGALLLSGGGDKVVRRGTATRTCTRSWTHGKKIACVGSLGWWRSHVGGPLRGCRGLTGRAGRGAHPGPRPSLARLAPTPRRVAPLCSRTGRGTCATAPGPTLCDQQYYLGHTAAATGPHGVGASSPHVRDGRSRRVHVEAAWRRAAPVDSLLQRACGRGGEATPAVEEASAAAEGGWRGAASRSRASVRGSGCSSSASRRRRCTSAR